MTPENLRYHAAGHLAAAHSLANAGLIAASQHVLRVVSSYAHHETVDAPPALREMIALCAGDPKHNTASIETLERWFVDPLNTIIEKNGGKF